jgi:hypothetical protein
MTRGRQRREEKGHLYETVRESRGNEGRIL